MRNESRVLQILDGDEVLNLSYREALDFHGNDAWFGVAVAFRMLQAAGDLLSVDRLWDRDGLYVVSGHPGRGVRDCVQYVTRCVTHGRYSLPTDVFEGRCDSAMQFYWEIGDGMRVASIVLRDDFIPAQFFELLDRHATRHEHPADADRLGVLKRELAEKVWAEPLQTLFHTQLEAAELKRHA